MDTAEAAIEHGGYLLPVGFFQLLQVQVVAAQRVCSGQLGLNEQRSAMRCAKS